MNIRRDHVIDAQGHINAMREVVLAECLLNYIELS